MCKHAAVGSYATKSNRYCALQQIATQLKQLGYRLKSARNIKPKHIEALVGHWKDEGLTAGTIKNRMTHLRFWAEHVGKKSIMKKTNDDYGIESRRLFKGNKAQQLDLEKLESIGCEYIKMALRLQAAFGLRREEALKFRPSLADKHDKIVLKASWTKGGKERTIPVTTKRQRDLLNEAHELVGNNSLIPNSKSYMNQINTYKHETAKAEMGKLHGLRHNYAQWRYKVLTGGMIPRLDGGKPYAEMTEEEKLLDTIARETISAELGHARLDVTNVYLGGRS